MKSGYFFSLTNGHKIDVAIKVTERELPYVEHNQIVLVRNSDLIKTHPKNYSMFLTLGFKKYLT